MWGMGRARPPQNISQASLPAAVLVQGATPARAAISRLLRRPDSGNSAMRTVATVEAFCRRAARAARLRERALAMPVACMGETGLRVAGATVWLYVICNDQLTFYRLGSRGDIHTCQGEVTSDSWDEAPIDRPCTTSVGCKVDRERSSDDGGICQRR